MLDPHCQTCSGTARMTGGAPCPFCAPYQSTDTRRLIRLAHSHPDPAVAREAARRLQERNR